MMKRILIKEDRLTGAINFLPRFRKEFQLVWSHKITHYILADEQCPVYHHFVDHFPHPSCLRTTLAIRPSPLNFGKAQSCPAGHFGFRQRPRSQNHSKARVAELPQHIQDMLSDCHHPAAAVAAKCRIQRSLCDFAKDSQARRGIGWHKELASTKMSKRQAEVSIYNAFLSISEAGVALRQRSLLGRNTGLTFSF